jgi:flavin-dependent dehydrogenase
MNQKSTKQRSVKIAGAGPSGLTAAIHLAKAGYEVEIVEAHPTVGARFIGDFQVIENMSQAEDSAEMLKRFGLSTNFFIQPVSNALFFDYRLRSQPVQSRRPFGYFIRRGPGSDTLDQGLLAQALAAGAKIEYQKRIKPEEADIIATGPADPDGLAKEVTFSTALPDTVWVIFDMNLSPGGYTYLFVLNGQAVLGCAITRDFSKITDYFERSVRRFRELASFEMESPKFMYSFMNFSLKKSAEVDHRLLVGEAGGFQDYLFGLGLRYALTTGFVAAQSMIRKESYDLLWKEAIGSAQEISLVNRYLYERGGNQGLATFIRRAGSGDVQDYLSGWHADAWWKRLLLPVIKWTWQGEKRCAHRLPLHWCRKKTKSLSHPALGPSES